MPESATGLVLFAHGSGSSRHSPRNQTVARLLEEHGLATLLIDLLTAEQDMVDRRTAQYRFDIDMLALRLATIIDWLREQPETSRLPIGLFGASTGAAAALLAAVERPDDVAAVVSRGGRSDLAVHALERVGCPTLFIVGEHDSAVVSYNRLAIGRMSGAGVLHIIPGATQLFEEEGALEQVAHLASEWFTRHLHHQSSRRPASR